MGDTLQLPPPEPFWFVNSELLEELLRAELSLMSRLLAHHPELGSLLDAPVATVSERKACFIVLAHRKVLEMVCEMLAARYEQPTLSDEESNALSATSNLVTIDAPEWVLETDRLVETLPFHFIGALPQTLRIERFMENDVEQIAALGTLSTVEQLQTLIESVFDQQLQRLEKRWSAGIPTAQIEQPLVTKGNLPKGTEGLVRKIDLSEYSRYMDNFTEKQRLAFVLKYEYGLGLTQIALRMGIDRKTADEHIKAAAKKVNQARSNEKRKARRAKNEPEF
ncbi:MAG TPA: sigma factor-like helix-turn-helix DNA-binding protein [Candidatus Acidoferrum sp.]|nr:sigma factor-like helix-turn-helix DNA-binding protein [Candidatus Acidoferrum sp.]